MYPQRRDVIDTEFIIFGGFMGIMRMSFISHTTHPCHVFDRELEHTIITCLDGFRAPPREK
jgi:hypothetical protein